MACCAFSQTQWLQWLQWAPCCPSSRSQCWFGLLGGVYAKVVGPPEQGTVLSFGLFPLYVLPWAWPTKNAPCGPHVSRMLEYLYMDPSSLSWCPVHPSLAPFAPLKSLSIGGCRRLFPDPSVHEIRQAGVVASLVTLTGRKTRVGFRSLTKKDKHRDLRRASLGPWTRTYPFLGRLFWGHPLCDDMI